MSKNPAEILGIPAWDLSAVQQALSAEVNCPFSGETCSKRNHVCSVQVNDETIAICPKRFLEQGMVFQDIAQLHFGHTHDLLLFSEVYSGNRILGTFDYVIAQHITLGCDIKDFIIVECQAVDTTMTGELNKALAAMDSGTDVTQASYGFGLNWANVWKRCFIQLLNKGRVLEQWGSRAYWVAQKQAYDYFKAAYGLSCALQSGSEGSTIFVTYDLARVENGYSLVRHEVESSTIAELVDAFAHNPEVPSRTGFIQRLQDKFEKKVALSISFE